MANLHKSVWVWVCVRADMSPVAVMFLKTDPKNLIRTDLQSENDENDEMMIAFMENGSPVVLIRCALFVSCRFVLRESDVILC